MDFNDRGGERGKRGEKRDSRLGQSQPHMARHATHKCQKKKRYARTGMSPKKACKINTIKYRTDRLPLVKVVK